MEYHKKLSRRKFHAFHEKWITDLANICDPGHSGASFYVVSVIWNLL